MAHSFPRTAALALAVLTTAAAGPVRAAGAAGPPAGAPCRSVLLLNPTADDGSQARVVDGGPVVAPGSAVTIRCAIHVNDDMHTGATAVAVEETGDGVAALPPTIMGYTAYDDIVYLCTQVTVDGTAWYPTDDGTWTTDAGTPCAPTEREEEDVEWCGSQYPLLEECVDYVLCPALAFVFPPQGDISGIWDCPPYGD